jgi:hypothetical protein
MISKVFTFILLLSLAVTFPACTDVRSSELKEVSLEDENNLGDVMITDEDVQSKQVSTSKGIKTEPARTLADKSEIITMFDGAGNKTETRYFKGHSRLQLVIVRTATDETKQIFVYGFGTEVMPMPEEFAATALSGSAEEIANAAGLKQTRPFKSSFPTISPTPTSAKMPKKNRPVEILPQVQTEETTNQQPTTEETENPSDETQNRQSDEESNH